MATVFNPLFLSPEWLNEYNTKYPHGFSVLENLIDWLNKVNEMITYLNLTKDQIDDLMEKTLPANVAAVLDEWYSNGKLSDLLNLQLLGGIKDEIIAARKTEVDLNARLEADYSTLDAKIEESKNNFYVNVKKFGAKGDGVTDDAAAIQAAINYAYTQITQYNLSGGWMFGGGKVFLPVGKYIIKTPLILKTNVGLEGESQQSVILDGEKISGDYSVTNIEGEKKHAECDITNMTFVNRGVYFISNHNSNVRDVSFFNVTLGNGIGLLMRLNVGNKIRRIHAYNCNTGIYISGSQGVGFSTTTYMDELWMAHCTTGLILSFDSNGIVTSTIKKSIFEYCNLGINMQGNIADLSLEDIHFEQNTQQAILAGLDDGANIKLRNIWNDSNGILFTSREYTENERFKVTAASFIGSQGITFQYGVRADFYLENSDVVYSTIPETCRVFNSSGDFLSTAPPSFGSWSRGNKVWNTAPNAGDYVGWVCISGGTPGTWKGFGLIQA